MRFDDGAGDSQMQPGMRTFAGTRGVGAEKAVEQAWQAFGRNRLAGVRDVDDSIAGRRAPSSRTHPSTLRGMPDGLGSTSRARNFVTRSLTYAIDSQKENRRQAIRFSKRTFKLPNRRIYAIVEVLDAHRNHRRFAAIAKSPKLISE